MRIFSIRASEPVQHSLLPPARGVRGQLEDRATLVPAPAAAKLGGSVEIACGVENQAGIGVRAIAASLETVEHLLCGASGYGAAGKHQNADEDRQQTSGRVQTCFAFHSVTSGEKYEPMARKNEAHAAPRAKPPPFYTSLSSHLSGESRASSN